MDLQQLQNMKASILADLEKQRKVTDALAVTLANLLELENILTGELTTHKPESLKAAPGILKATATLDGEVKAISPTTRVENALNKIVGGFTRQQLFEAVNKDGNGEMIQRDYASVFHRLKQKSQIKLFSGKEGTRDCKYIKMASASDVDSLFSK